ncbi:MAG: LytTR family DNA-binding domain-containing protein [Bacteroidota bacterium]
MKCIIIDDEEMAIKVLESHISKISNLEIIATYNNAMDAFASMQNQQIDLVFLDIQMPKLTGFGLLKTLSSYPNIIITTAHREYALESYDFIISDYLLKPISFERFLKAVSKVQEINFKSELSNPAVQTINDSTPPFFYIRSDRRFVKINLDTILYIESIRNHVRIVTTDGNHITQTMISEMEEKLPPQYFLRIHRSYIVAKSKIQEFTKTNLTINKKTIPIGNFYKREVLKQLEELLF